MKAIGYVRVSTDEQALGVEAQQVALQAYADGHGLELGPVHVDRGISGATPLDERPGLLAATSELGAGDVLLVVRRDRLARDVVVAALVERLVERAGARIVSCAGEGNEGGPAGELLRSIVDAFAQYERALIRARTKAALAVKRSRGERTGSIPAGHTVEAGQIVPTSAVELASELRAEGLSCQAIADKLNADGYPAQGSRWHLTTVRRMLQRAGAL